MKSIISSFLIRYRPSSIMVRSLPGWIWFNIRFFPMCSNSYACFLVIRSGKSSDISFSSPYIFRKMLTVFVRLVWGGFGRLHSDFVAALFCFGIGETSLPDNF